MAETSICGRSSSDLAPDVERITIRDIVTAAESNTKEGDTFYLLIQRWWQHWLEYVNHDESSSSSLQQEQLQHFDSSGSVLKRPSVIDNFDLIYDSSTEGMEELHDTLVEGRDYVLLPQPVWNQLYLWYGGGPAVARKVIKSGLSQTELSVEVYPLCLQLLVMPKGDQTTIRISKKETIGELHKRACEVFDLNLEQVCIWDYYGQRKHALMNDMDKTLDDANIQTDQDILVEVLNNVSSASSRGCSGSVQENGCVEKEATSALVEPSKSGLSIAGGSSASRGVSRSGSSELSQNQSIMSPVREVDTAVGTSGVSTRGVSAGLTGLLNLGNTCFMNSAIQCLVHTPELAKYFREDYHQEINWQNPLGMVGELALAFGELLRKLWASGRVPVAPRPFKTKLARFAPQFSGYNQHDSQELLAFLLDGLHEDLNRVKHKPYIKSKDADGRPDEEVADEYWANHVARNDSIIVDVCQGQYKSTLVCPVCNKISVTFDPFMYLSLPLQSTTTRTMTVTVFTCDRSVQPTTCTVTVPKQGCCRDLIQAVISACFLKHTEKILLAEIRGHLVHRFLEDPFISLSTIKDDDRIAAYKIPKLDKRTTFLQLIHRHEEQKTTNSGRNIGWVPYGTPHILPIPCNEVITKDDIKSIVHTMLSPMLKLGRTSELSCCTNTGSSSTDSLPDGGNCSTLAMLPKLPLHMVGENNASIDLSIEEEKDINLSSSSVLVYINWSQKLLVEYDTKYLENLPEFVKYGPVPKKARTEPLSLYTCLEAFLREEPLVPEDMWFCPQCKEQRQASKKLDLWRLPEVLVIHLKRFSYSRSMKHKLETFVNFPIHDFDLTKYVANKNSDRPQLYELYALTNHYGTMGNGHYTAHIKLLDENKWYNFDDSHIAALNEDEVKLGAAYVLFYRRVKIEN